MNGEHRAQRRVSKGAVTSRAKTEYEVRVRPAALGHVSALSYRVSALYSLPTQYKEVRSWWRPTERWAIASARNGMAQREVRLARMRERLRNERVVL